ncbi:hypothetical protein BC937DRAFT_90432, partial [Endogone sp. FLAS-F59071]
AVSASSDYVCDIIPKIFISSPISLSPVPSSTMSTLTSIFTAHSSTCPAIIIPSTSPNPVTLSYPQFHQALRSFQRQLTAQLPDLKPGSVVSASLPNSLEFAITFLGSTNLRLVSAPLNSAYKEEEFKFYLDDAKSSAMIVTRGEAAKNSPAVKAAKSFGIAVVEVWWDSAKKDVVVEVIGKGKKGGKGVDDSTIKPEPEDVALLLHTSGTTGKPKGVPLTHLNLTTTMANIIRTYDLVPTDRTLLVMPLFHVHGLMCSFLATLLSGGTVVIPPKFSATTFWKEFEEGSCNWYTAVPTIHQILLVHPPAKTPHLRFIRSCSSALAPATFHALESAFKAPVLEAYSMTEATHQMTSNPLPPKSRKPGSVGLGQGVEVAVLDETGVAVAQGEIGEVCIRGANVTKGYLNNAKASAESFHRDRWFRTGDQGKLDPEGYLFLTGRLKELINRGGEKISPVEVDSAMLEHPAVAEAVSFAVPDEMYGQEVQAAIVLRNDYKKSEEAKVAEEVRKFLETKLAKFKVPKKIYVTDTMPKTATGKIQRKVVSEHFFKLDGKKGNGKAKL